MSRDRVPPTLATPERRFHSYEELERELFPRRGQPLYPDPEQVGREMGEAWLEILGESLKAKVL
jgi:hypothetical protein